MKVSKTADGTNAKTYRIASTNNLTNIVEWVENNRDSVDKATNGQTLRAHSRDGPTVAERFQNEIDRFCRKRNHHRHPQQRRRQHRPEILDILERQPYQF